MDMSLRSAFIISAVIHAAVFTPFYNQHMLRQETEKRNSVIVDYVVLKEIANAIAMNKEVVMRLAETPRIEIKKEIAVKPQQADQKKTDYKKRLEARKKKEKERSHKQDAAKSASEAAAKKDAELTSNKDYVSYYQLIREKIRARLKTNYAYYSHEGDVYLSFTITPNGTLLTYRIDRAKSTQDEVLLHITATSLKAVSPFPPMPRSLSAPKMSFSIIISFRK